MYQKLHCTLQFTTYLLINLKERKKKSSISINKIDEIKNLKRTNHPSNNIVGFVLSISIRIESYRVNIFFKHLWLIRNNKKPLYKRKILFLYKNIGQDLFNLR